MRITYHGHNVEVTDSMRSFVENKAKSLEKYAGEDDALGVTAEVVKGQKRASMVLAHQGKAYAVSSESTDFYDAVLSSLDKLKKQLKEDKSRREAKKHIKVEAPEESENDVLEDK